MEKILSNAKCLRATIHTNQPSRIFLPKSVCTQIDGYADAVYSVDLWIDKTTILIEPNNEAGEFALSTNGANSSGRIVRLPAKYIERYDVREGHYDCDVDKDGKITIHLDKRFEDRCEYDV